MNIFILDNDPVIAAQLQCDKHVVKMVLESAQLLSTAHHIYGDIDSSALYKKTHENHPSAIWARESVENYIWLYNHFIGLCDEYTHRYNKIHKTDTKFRKVLGSVPVNIKAIVKTPFKLAISNIDECVGSNAVELYQSYYKTKKDKFVMKWTNRDIPWWFLE